MIILNNVSLPKSLQEGILALRKQPLCFNLQYRGNTTLTPTATGGSIF
jgi:hypothetical protein